MVCGRRCSSRWARARRSRAGPCWAATRCAGWRCGTAGSTRTGVRRARRRTSSPASNCRRAPASSRPGSASSPTSSPATWGCPPTRPMAGLPEAAFYLYPDGYLWEDGRLVHRPEGAAARMRRRTARAGRRRGCGGGRGRPRRRAAAGHRAAQRLPARRVRGRRGGRAGAHPRRLGLPGEPLAPLQLRRSRPRPARLLRPLAAHQPEPVHGCWSEGGASGVGDAPAPGPWSRAARSGSSPSATAR